MFFAAISVIGIIDGLSWDRHDNTTTNPEPHRQNNGIVLLLQVIVHILFKYTYLEWILVLSNRPRYNIALQLQKPGRKLHSCSAR